MRQTGLFFGSFNPIHIGHLALANYMCEFEEMDEIWFVVSPLNPFKAEEELIDTNHRLEMARLATAHYPKFRVEDIELSLPVPSYTIDTLNELHKRHPENTFSIIMGADNIQNIDRWKEADSLISNYRMLIYPRMGYSTGYLKLPENIRITNAPCIEMTSTNIRNWIKKGKDIPFFTTRIVYDYIKSNNLYK